MKMDYPPPGLADEGIRLMAESIFSILKADQIKNGIWVRGRTLGLSVSCGSFPQTKHTHIWLIGGSGKGEMDRGPDT